MLITGAGGEVADDAATLNQGELVNSDTRSRTKHVMRVKAHIDLKPCMIGFKRTMKLQRLANKILCGRCGSKKTGGESERFHNEAEPI